MAFVLSLVVLSCFLNGAFSSLSASEYTGLEVRLTQKGLQYIAENIVFPLEGKLQSFLHIPNLSLDVDTFIVNLTNVKLVNVTFHEPQIVVNESLSALVMTSRADVHGYVNFTYKQKVLPVHGGGYFSFQAESVTLRLGLGVEPGRSDTWNFTVHESELDIPALTVTCLSSDACIILNRVKSYIVKDAISNIQSMFKKNLPAIIQLLNMIAMSYVPVYKINDDFALNLSLVHSREQWKDNCFIRLGVVGAVLYKGHGALPFAPPLFPETSDCSGNMVTAHVSTSTISSGLAALSRSMLATEAISLKLFTNSTVLRNFFPDIGKVTPVAMVWLNASLDSATVHSSPDHLHLSTTILAQVDLHFGNGTVLYNAAKFSVELDGVLEVWLKTLDEPQPIGKLSAVCVNISELQATSVKGIHSIIGPIDGPFFKENINFLITERLPDVNKLVRSGAYVLPEDLKLVWMGNYTLVIGQGYIVLGADFHPKPKTASWLGFYPSEIVSPLFETIVGTTAHLVSSLSEGLSGVLRELSNQAGAQEILVSD